MSRPNAVVEIQDEMDSDSTHITKLRKLIAYSPTMSTPAMLSVSFQSCNVHPCDVVCQFPVLQIQPSHFNYPTKVIFAVLEL